MMLRMLFYAALAEINLPVALAMHLLGNAVCPPVAADVITAIREAA